MKSLLAFAFLISGFAVAQDYPLIEKGIKTLQPTAKIISIEKSAIPTLFEVRMNDFEPVYMTEDGRHFIMGTLLEITPEGRVTNHTQEKLRQERKQLLARVPMSDVIVYKPTKPKKVVWVFTDVDCGYCRKFHTEVPEYNAAGIEIRYVAYPRGGLEAESFKKMASIWCQADRGAALTKVKAGGEITETNCPNAVAAQYRLGQAMSVQGTPAVFTEDGDQLGGYLTPDQMKKALGL